MPTILSHPAVPLALGLGFGARVVPPRVMIAGIVASIVPDFDVLGFWFGIPYAASFGHRGATHSLAFAVLLGSIALALAPRLQATRPAAFLFVTVAAASHGLLDTCTNGGLGIALGWPWTEARFFAPWRVIEVSPLSLRGMMSARGIDVLRSELQWVWLPAALVFAGLFSLRRSRQNSGTRSKA